MVFTTTAANLGYAEDHLINKIGSLTDNRESMVWENLAGNKLSFQQKNTATDFLDYKDQVFLTEKTAKENIPAKAIFLEAKPVSGSQEYGIKGTYTIKLPEKQTIQFQGAAQILSGKKEGAVFSFQIWAPSEKDPNQYEMSKEFFGDASGDDGNDFDGFRMFILDLSAWAGKEIKIVPVLKVKPSYSNVSGKEQWTPNKIAVQIGDIDIIASKFSVTLGDPEIAEEPVIHAKSNFEKGLAKSMISVTTDTSEEKVISGQPIKDAGLLHPGDSGLPSIYLPSTSYTNARWISYFGSGIDPLSGSSTECIDFASSTTVITMATATVQEVRSHILDDNSDGRADSVLGPNNPPDDNWPNYVAIYSAITNTFNPIGGGGSYPILHAFVHTEDDMSSPSGCKYTRITYARSYGNNSSFGKSFTKTTYSSAGYPIITHPSSEIAVSQLASPNKMFGTGSPNVYEVGDYYYMVYDVRANDYDSDGNGNLLYQGVPGISIARALKNSVNSNVYSASANPWIKFKEVVANDSFNAQNWTEPGFGGDYSYLINAKFSNGKRINQLADRNLWRAFPRVSFNEYLAIYYQSQNQDQMVMICAGQASLSSGNCVMIYTSKNLVDWSSAPLIICYESPSQENFRYPTLIGRNDELFPGYSSGWSALTTQVNTLYYQVLRTEGQHLYRRKLTFTVN